MYPSTQQTPLLKQGPDSISRFETQSSSDEDTQAQTHILRPRVLIPTTTVSARPVGAVRAVPYQSSPSDRRSYPRRQPGYGRGVSSATCLRLREGGILRERNQG